MMLQLLVFLLLFSIVSWVSSIGTGEEGEMVTFDKRPHSGKYKFDSSGHYILVLMRIN